MADEDILTSNELLKAFLESIVEGGAYARFGVALALKDALTKATDEEIKRVIEIEVFFKYMQLFEDFGAFCLMWLDPTKHPLELYIHTATRQVVNFYGECLNCLSDTKVCTIYGIERAEKLLEQKLIRQEDVAKFHDVLDKSIPIIQGNLRQFGKLFAKDDAGKIGYTGLVNAYFNAKHGFKVLRPTVHGQKFGAKKNEVMIFETQDKVDGVGTSKNPHFQISWGGWKLGTDVVTRLVEQMLFFSREMKQLAEIRLHLMDDPLYVYKTLKESLSNSVNGPGKQP